MDEGNGNERKRKKKMKDRRKKDIGVKEPGFEEEKSKRKNKMRNEEAGIFEILTSPQTLHHSDNGHSNYCQNLAGCVSRH